jgi:hypothetical protein
MTHEEVTTRLGIGHPLELARDEGGPRYFLCGRRVCAGQVLEHFVAGIRALNPDGALEWRVFASSGRIYPERAPY